MRDISQTVWDRAYLSTEHHYKVVYELSKKEKYLTFGDPERPRSLNDILDAEYLENGMR